MASNGVMMQFFHWYTPEDGSLWNEVAQKAPELAEKEITAFWLPPPYKGTGGGLDVGYGVYDLFDLGEFDQKSSVRTKYGTKDKFVAAVKAAKDAGISVYADTVFNHKLGADEEEEAQAKPLNPDNRNEALGDFETVKVWTHFTFPGRAGKYSKMEWHWHHFTAIDYNAYADEGAPNAVYLFEGASFDQNVDLEKGNFDYLMGCDLNMEHPEVVGELDHWGEWFVDLTGVDGFRFDAVKHVGADFFRRGWSVYGKRPAKTCSRLANTGRLKSTPCRVLSTPPAGRFRFLTRRCTTRFTRLETAVTASICGGFSSIHSYCSSPRLT